MCFGGGEMGARSRGGRGAASVLCDRLLQQAVQTLSNRGGRPLLAIAEMSFQLVHGAAKPHITGTGVVRFIVFFYCWQIKTQSSHRITAGGKRRVARNSRGRCGGPPCPERHGCHPCLWWTARSALCSWKCASSCVCPPLRLYHNIEREIFENQEEITTLLLASNIEGR